ncbi:MAG: TIGR00299 family protein, partial [Alicyclobacillus sp. RIFOXYA1_FULL_53_8]
HEHHEHRRARGILDMIVQSNLPERVKSRSQAVFYAIAQAEAKIHGMDVDSVHFHEVGAMDSIVDIIGVCLALESLDVDEVWASPVPTGRGRVSIAHGRYPIPAPATAELLRGIPLSDLDAEGELTTPTGAGFLAVLVRGFTPMLGFRIDEIGYGAGDKEFEHPNVLRALLVTRNAAESEARGSATASASALASAPREEVVVLECEIDDMTGEVFGYVFNLLLAAGALDVYYTPVYMKKNRPGILVSVMVKAALADACEEILLIETTTLGVRKSVWTRRVLERRMEQVSTRFGTIRVKQGWLGPQMLHQKPEYDDVSQAAKEHGVPFQVVYQAALN